MSRAVAVAARLVSAGFVVATAALLAIGATGSGSLRRWAATEGPGCPLRALCGLPCPFCGMTRATLALGAGEVDTALGFHPLAPVVVLGTVVVAAAIAAGRDRWLLRPPAPGVVLAAVLGIWAVNLAAA